MKAFVTGSRKYGKARENSDIDLVVFVESNEDIMALDRMQGCVKGPRLMSMTSQENGGLHVYRFGDLNLMAVTKEEWYRVWKEGTEECMNQDLPITREQAVEIFKKHEKEKGVR